MVSITGADAGSCSTEQKSLQIFTLGRFSLVRDGMPLQYSRKAPSKPLQLLKALIASGGREIGSMNLAAILWPDLDGDRARQTFEVTLHRLRKYLGNDGYLLLQDGRLTLNSDLVWVDVWAFERGVGAVRKLLQLSSHAEQSQELHNTAQDCLHLYQGHFLGRDDAACWSVSLQERLRHKFIRCVIELGDYWEQTDCPDRAIHCYQLGIDVDDLVEVLYQRLMVCYEKTGQLSEALAIYRKCRNLLSVVLGLAPTRATQTIYQSILNHYQKAG